MRDIINMTRQDTYDMSSDTICAKAYKLTHEDPNNPDLTLLVDELIVRVQVYANKVRRLSIEDPNKSIDWLVAGDRSE